MSTAAAAIVAAGCHPPGSAMPSSSPARPVAIPDSVRDDDPTATTRVNGASGSSAAIKEGPPDVEAWSPSGHRGWPKGQLSNAIDGNVGTKFCCPTRNNWPVIIEMDLPRGSRCRLTEYALTAADDVPERGPKHWTVKGSVDGDTWTDIATVRDHEIMVRHATSAFPVSSDASYSMFQFVFDANHGADGFQLAEIALKGVVTRVAIRDQPTRFSDPLPLPSAEEVKNALAREALPTTYSNEEGLWSFRGIVGPLGVMAQRHKIKAGYPAHRRVRAYRVLSVDEGSPSHGRLLPGDHIIGLDGKRFQPGTYVNKEAESFKSYREPNWEMGRAIQAAYGERKGELTLTVERGGEKGTVTMSLGAKPAFSSTYPWNCDRSRQLCEEIARNYMREWHENPKLEPWRAAWYGLFLMNLDPIRHRQAIDDIVKRVRERLDGRSLAGQVRGVRNSNNIWQIAVEAVCLAEYAMLTDQEQVLHRDLDRYVQLLFASRMIGDLWGHSDNFNYGMMRGGFMGASCQSAIALICLKQAGAKVTRGELNKVLDGLSASMDRRSGNVKYHSLGDGRAMVPFDWSAIDANTEQVETESIMRQGTVHLAMSFAERTTEAEATYRFLRRQTVVFATHGMTQDAGVFEGARALASSNPADCRALLDSYLPRLCMSLRWDGGVHLIPSGRDPSGSDEYSAYRERGIEQYIPAVMGLLLSMPEKRLYLFQKVLGPNDKPRAWAARRPRPALSKTSVRYLTYWDSSAYYVERDLTEPTQWAVFRREFKGNGTAGKVSTVIGGLDSSPYELFVWRDKLFISAEGRHGAVMTWDIAQGGEPRVLNKYTHSRASMFTEYRGALYYLSPQDQLGQGSPYIGGVLWKTRDGVTAERVNVVPDDKPLWGLLHGCASWQTISPNARSLKVVELGDGPRLFCQTQKCSGGSANWTKPVPGGQNLWVSDGSPGKARRFGSGHLEVSAVDDNNSRVGSLIGWGYANRLFFSKKNLLHASDTQGIASTPLKLGGRTFASPNNFATFKHKGRLALAFSYQSSKGGRRIAITDGKKLLAEIRADAEARVDFTDVRYLTAVGDSLYFVGITPAHGAELWHTQGDVAGTRMVRDFEPGAANSLVENLVALKGKIYFTAWDERYGSELWRHDPMTGRLELADVVRGDASSRPQHIRAYGDWIVFAMDATIDGSPILRYADGVPNEHVVFTPVEDKTALTGLAPRL